MADGLLAGDDRGKLPKELRTRLVAMDTARSLHAPKCWRVGDECQLVLEDGRKIPDARVARIDSDRGTCIVETLLVDVGRVQWIRETKLIAELVSAPKIIDEYPRTRTFGAQTKSWSIPWHRSCRIDCVRLHVLSVMLVARRIGTASLGDCAQPLRVSLPFLPTDVWILVLSHLRAPFDFVETVFDLVSSVEDLPPICAQSSCGYEDIAYAFPVAEPEEAHVLKVWSKTHKMIHEKLDGRYVHTWVCDWLGRHGFEEYGRAFTVVGVVTKDDLFARVSGGPSEISMFLNAIDHQFPGGKLQSEAECTALATALAGFAKSQRHE
jgi:hypothetical protein